MSNIVHVCPLQEGNNTLDFILILLIGINCWKLVKLIIILNHVV